MSGNISKSDQVLLDAAKDLQDTRDAVEGDINNLRTKLNNLNGQWEGGASKAFASLMVEWEKRQKGVISYMENFKQSLVDTDEHYNVTDSDVTAVFNKYAGGLGG